jgi:RimJ/RimL family protein N-acetyltransferase
LTFPSLTTDRIRLRKFAIADISWIGSTCDRPEMAQFIAGLPSPYTEEHARQFVERAERVWADGTSAPFVIESLDGEPLGAVEVTPRVGDPGVANIGYWLRQEARGRGAASDAVRVVSRWALETMGVARLGLFAHVKNEPSQRVAERAGFVREGTLRAWEMTPTGRRDTVAFSLLPTDLR